MGNQDRLTDRRVSVPITLTAWPIERCERLAELWNSSLSTVQIGREMQSSKNSIVGKAHRLGLPERPSPIIRRGDKPRPIRVERIIGPSLPPLASLVAEPAPVVPIRTISPVVSRAISEVRKHLSAGKPSPFDNLAHRPVPVAQPVARPYSHFAKCQFIAGTWRVGQIPKFCDKPAFPGRSYCEACCHVCYQGFRGDAPPRVVDIDRFFPKPLNVPISGPARF